MQEPHGGLQAPAIHHLHHRCRHATHGDGQNFAPRAASANGGNHCLLAFAALPAVAVAQE